MNVIPAGNRRQMESQQYSFESTAAEGILELMLRKAAALDIAPDNAIDDFSRSPEMPGSLGENPEGNQRGELSDAMNQSMTLPQSQKQEQQGIMVVNKDGQPRQDQQGQVTKQILEMLQKSKLADPGTYVLTDFDLSNGIQLNAVRQSANAGPAVQKP